jgi:hypothetical protein
VVAVVGVVVVVVVVCVCGGGGGGWLAGTRTNAVSSWWRMCVLAHIFEPL